MRAGPTISTSLTYREAQGVAHIEKAYAALREARLSTQGMAPWVALQAIELIYWYGAEDLRRLAANQFSLAAAPRVLVWVEEMLDIAHALMMLAKASPVDGPTSGPVSPAMQAFAAQYSALEGQALMLIEGNDQPVADSIDGGGVTDGQAVAAHLLKNIFHINSLIWAAWALPGEGGPADNDALASETLAHAITDVPRADGPLLAFRLMHQVPELCALLILDLFAESGALLQAQRFTQAYDHMRTAGDFMSIILLCQHPVRKLMLPSEYYRIRSYFGETSGAHSTTLRGELMGSAYLKLAADVDETVGSNDDPGSQLVRKQLRAISAMVHNWRALHLAFPRNLLGGFGAASLAGSPDGLRAAEFMRRQFAQMDPVTHGDTPAQRPVPPGLALDQQLRHLTASATKARYADVQRRAAPREDD
jgi:hypothetical protein